MGLHVKHDVKIARGRAVRARISMPRDPYARSGFHPGRDPHVQRFRFANAPFAAARRASGTQTSRATAARTSHIEAHVAAGARGVAAAAALRAHLFG